VIYKGRKAAITAGSSQALSYPATICLAPLTHNTNIPKMKLFITVVAALVGLSIAGPVDIESKASKLSERQTCACYCDGILAEPPLDSCLESFGSCEACCDYVVSAYKPFPPTPYRKLFTED
jgi:hypothetical protein